jgi:hypothetical protein
VLRKLKSPQNPKSNSPSNQNAQSNWNSDEKQIQRGDVFEKYKHNLVGVKEQLN